MDFVVGHTRAGGFALAWLLNLDGEMSAQINCLIHLSANRLIADATEYYEGTRSKEQVSELFELYQYPLSRVDVSWKLTWIMPPLLEAFPTARIVHLTRDPRTNVRSTFNSDFYGNIVGQDRSERLRPRTLGNPMRPASWQSFMPRIRHPDWERLDQLEKNCVFWTEAHRLILTAMRDRPDQYLQVRSEDVLADARALRRVFEFLRLRCPPDDALQGILSALSGVKLNGKGNLRAILSDAGKVPLPEFEKWTPAQQQALIHHCGEMAARLGYTV